MTDINQTHWSASRWAEAIDAHLAANGPQAPFVNIDSADAREFDAIFLGGAAGRFGAAYLRAMGGRPLIIDRWPFLGGSCPHHACVPHHVFADVAAQLLLERTFSGKLWFQNMDGKIVSMLEIVDMFRRGRTGPHAFMNYQSKEQLDLEFVLGAPATIVDAQRVAVAGQTYTAKNLVLATGSRAKALAIIGQDLQGVFNYATLVDNLDYEPGATAVVIGGGKTAVEYGCFFNATGRRTLMVSRDRPLAMMPDAETRAFLLTRMQEQGMEFLSGAELLVLDGDSQGRVKTARIRTPSGEIEVATDFVFLATGQTPNSEAARQILGVQADAGGFIQINSRMRKKMGSKKDGVRSKKRRGQVLQNNTI